MVEYFAFHHPIVRDSKFIFAEFANLNSRNEFEKAGMKTEYSIKYSEMAQIEEFK